MTDDRLKKIVRDSIDNKPLNIGSEVKDILQTRVADAIDKKRPEIYGQIVPEKKTDTEDRGE